MSNLALQEAFDAQIASSRKSVEALNKQLTAKEDSQVAQDAADVRTASMVLAAMSKIRIPADGKNGKSGIDGFDGMDGIPGIDGIQGIRGFKGDKGATGITGAVGAKGVPGKDGRNAIDGIEGLKGETGIQGPTGKDGKDGVQGIKGLDGKSGIDGITGIDGKEGPRGQVGSVGPKGLDGSNGLSIPGTDGTNGVDGKAGKHGTDGKSGKDGLKGKEGARGKKGTEGVGIQDITTEGDDLKIKLSDGKVKTVSISPLTGKSRKGAAASLLPVSIQPAIKTPFNSSTSVLVSTNVQDAIVETVGKIQQSASGNLFPLGTAAGFLYTFNIYEDTHEADFVYNAGKQLISKSVVDTSNNVLYLVNFEYTGNILTLKSITDLVNTDSVDITFTYTDELLTRKSCTYIG